MARDRKDAATLGDLEDLADAIRGGFKDALGNVIPAPTPKPDDDAGKGDDGDAGKGDDGDAGKGGGGSDWGFKGRWWGGS